MALFPCPNDSLVDLTIITRCGWSLAIHFLFPQMFSCQVQHVPVTCFRITQQRVCIGTGCSDEPRMHQCLDSGLKRIFIERSQQCILAASNVRPDLTGSVHMCAFPISSCPDPLIQAQPSFGLSVSFYFPVQFFFIFFLFNFFVFNFITTETLLTAFEEK